MKMNSLIVKVMFLMLISSVGNGLAQEIVIDLSKEFQTIRGFGGMSHTTWIKDLNEDNREKAFGNDPGEMGLSILRIHLDPNPDRFSLELPTAQYAIQKGAIVFATPWDAPDALLDTNATLKRVDPNKYGEYVAHLNAFNTVMANNGVPLYALSVQNEPDYGDWTRWTSAEMVNFMKNFAQNIENRVMAPESFQFRRAYTDPILNDTLALANLDIVGGHIYGGGLFDYPLAREKGKEVWMTEHLLGSNANETNDWNLALVVGKEINDCMKANFNAYIWWYIRRFYGLITDDGNISDKGYVISQFSKFVRPGAVRVDAENPVSLIDITAYKTDTSFVIVVVNRNSTSANLNFNIKNGIVDKLTQFTSSSIKKVANDGDLTVSGGLFTATVDAKSVTTFSSYSGNGGKKDNVNPIVVAGDDLIIDDTVGIGSAIIKLDGSLSTDADGEIVNYSWSLNGQQVAWTPEHELTITVGEYNMVLTVTDNDGATATDTLHVILNSTKNTEIWLEAECGTVGTNWQKLSDANASNGSYVVTTDGIQSLANASTESINLLVYNFTTNETGNYKIFGRVITPSANDDSYWVKVDNSDWTMWNSIPAGSDWHWDDLHDQINDNVVFYQLEPGDHTLSICMREDGAKLDKILIANNGITPTGLGGEANGCQPNGVNPHYSNATGIAVYPNPSAGIVNIEWMDGFDFLHVFKMSGESVYIEHFNTQLQKTHLNLNLNPGIYFILLQGNNTSGVSKLIVE